MKARIVVLCAAVITLSGCLDVTTEITFSSESSGELSLHYEIPQDTFYMGVFDEESSFVPIPVRRADFERVARITEGVSLSSYSKSQSDGVVIVDGSYRFDSLSGLNGLYGNGERAITLRRDGTASSYSQLLFPGVGAVAESTREFIREYGGGHSLTYIVHAPEAIDSANIGSVRPSGAAAEVTLPLEELGNYNDPLVWELKW